MTVSTNLVSENDKALNNCNKKDPYIFVIAQIVDRDLYE